MPQSKLDIQLDLEDDTESAPPAPSNSWYDTLTSPLTTWPSRAAKSVSDYITTPTLSTSPTGDGGIGDFIKTNVARARGFSAGMIEGVGDLASQMTSPADLAATIATGGSGIAAKKGLGTVAKGLSYVGRAASAPVALHGGQTMINPESTMSERGMGLMELAGGVAGMGQAHPSIKSVGASSRVTSGVKPKLTNIADDIVDPNLKNGMGDPELAGSTPYPEAVEWKPPTKKGMTLDIIDDVDDGIQTNGSGGGDDSIEAINRLKGMKDKGQTMFLVDRAGNATPLKDVGGVDVAAPKGFTKVMSDAEGIIQILEDNGGRVPPGGIKIKPDSFPTDIKSSTIDMPKGMANEWVTVTRNEANPSRVKQLRELGYEFGGKDSKDNFIFKKTGKPTKQPVLEGEVGVTRPTGKQSELQTDLKGAKPRYSIGGESYSPQFADDLDKALFIVAQKTPSKRDADYLNYIMKQTGMNEVQARIAGNKIKTEVKNLVSGQSSGPIDIPAIHSKPAAVTPTLLSNTPPPISTNETIPPIKPPITPNGPPMDSPMGPDNMGNVDTPPAPPGKGNLLLDAYNLPRSTMASIDLSAPLRQGLGLVHKKEFYTSLAPMFKALVSEKAYKASQDAITIRPLFRERKGPGGKTLPSFASEAGLFLGDLSDINMREESMVSTIAEKIPGVRPSNRAYTAFLNNLRADTFDTLVNTSKVFGPDAQADLPLARALADFVNTASGRGSLGRLESSAKVLSAVMFSPRLMASRLKLLNPQYYWSAPSVVRKEALKSLFAIAAVGNTVGQLGRMAGGTIETDMGSSDFGKLKIGDTRIDPFGGFQQYVVAANRLITGHVKSSTSGTERDLWNPKGPYDPTHTDIIERFARGKMHPTLGFIYSILKGTKEMSGEKMNFTATNPMENSITQRFIPLMLQDMYEVSQESPELLPVTVPLSMFGMGTQTYTGDRRP